VRVLEGVPVCTHWSIGLRARAAIEHSAASPPFPPHPPRPHSPAPAHPADGDMDEATRAALDAAAIEQAQRVPKTLRASTKERTEEALRERARQIEVRVCVRVRACMLPRVRECSPVCVNVRMPKTLRASTKERTEEALRERARQIRSRCARARLCFPVSAVCA